MEVEDYARDDPDEDVDGGDEQDDEDCGEGDSFDDGEAGVGVGGFEEPFVLFDWRGFWLWWFVVWL